MKKKQGQIHEKMGGKTGKKTGGGGGGGRLGKRLGKKTGKKTGEKDWEKDWEKDMGLHPRGPASTWAYIHVGLHPRGPTSKWGMHPMTILNNWQSIIKQKVVDKLRPVKNLLNYHNKVNLSCRKLQKSM